MSIGEVRYEFQDGIGIVTLSRPEKRNSMTRAMFGQLAGVVSDVEKGDEVRVLVIRGEEGAGFCAGDDLSELVRIQPSGIRDFLLMGQDILTRLESLPLPVIAAIDGNALGGGLELALACDLILASEGAKLGLPEIGLGIIPGLGGTIRLPRAVGPGRAREMIFSGRMLGASEALAWGLVQAVFPEEGFFRKVLEFAGSLCLKSRASLALAKSTINRGVDASLEAGLALEREAFSYCFCLPDAKEGISAFLEKRKPVFR